ncbi:cbb3-type cytochrome c oxidase subunit II [Luteolibacter yonseiensis]|uniref:Cbb3-type cytochrome c oxidase subunit II n=1 Tax=Luteolibacter yonseiensis TaxID=1144680 RepID=A0A934V9J5_9BACT|nr:cbb3-type cytochrome c oxidase subunit II [Luteolibacter yonseiensis]MBK1815213.1 cbb3-type cytochrome c oxidase subunit II [Luteolibacter yonseiensis]
MSFRTFILGLSASFGVAWLAIVVVPFIKMRNLAPIELNEATDGATGIFFPKRTGRVADGAQVYAENGCYLCHTQVVRPTYAGNDLYRPDWGGLKADPDRGDTRRETNAYDFFGEKFAQIGVSRMGPDLSNLGRRVESIYAKDGSATQWLYSYLYNPRHIPENYQSTCPSFSFLFHEQPVKGERNADALPYGGTDDTEIVPGPEVKALVSYLLSLKKDQAVPTVLNFAPDKGKAAKK